MILGHHTEGSGTAVTFVHGFTQTRSSWSPVVSRLRHVDATFLDAPGHGESPDGARSLWQCADDIAATMPRGVLVGYSMGARMALHTALAHPERVTALVLVSGTPGIEDVAERDARRSSDNSLAERIEEIGVPAFIDEWLSNPMFAGLTEATAMRGERLRNTARGLADSLRHAGTGTQDDLWARIGALTMPVLLVAGEDDTKFTGIARRMHGAIAGSVLEVLPSVGHTVHLEVTEQFADLLGRWILTNTR